MKKKTIYLIAVLLFPLASLLFLTSPASAATTCVTVPWGSLDKGDTAVVGGSTVSNVRSGRHDCFDQIVIDLNGPTTSFSVRYANEIIGDATGEPATLAGAAFLDVRVGGTIYDVHTGEITYQPKNQLSLVDLNGYDALRQVALVSSFEGQTQFGVGVRGRLPFRAFTLSEADTSKLVIDVAHSW